MRDEYQPVAGLLPRAERVLEWLLWRSRRDVARIARRHGLTQVLDVACGAGGLSRRLARAGLQPVGVDASWTMLAQAAAQRAHGPRFPLLLADAGALPLRTASQDAAVLSLALHEMEPPLRERVWREMHRVVRPGGLVILIDFEAVSAGIPARWARRVIAGGEERVGRFHPPHYTNYRSFMAAGGVEGWLAAHPAPVAVDRRYYWGNVRLVAVQQAPAGQAGR